MLLHIFRAESGALAKRRGRRPESARAAGGARRVRGFKWQVLREVTRRGRQPFKPQTVLLRWKASAGRTDLAPARHWLCLRSRTRRRPRPRLRLREWWSMGVLQYWASNSNPADAGFGMFVSDRAVYDEASPRRKWQEQLALAIVCWRSDFRDPTHKPVIAKGES